MTNLAKAGGRNNNSTMEARVARLEILAEATEKRLSSIEADLRDFRGEVRNEFRSVRQEMREDFRIVWGGLIAGGVMLSGLMAKGFHWL